jgi:hypothetical protein
MTLGNVLHILRARWPLTAAGLLLTVVAVAVLSARSGVYTTSVDVQLIPPEHVGTGISPSPETSLIALAGLVEREVGDEVQRTEPVSPDATLAGLGVDRGTLVTLPNYGGQWNYFFEVPVLRVQAVAPTAAEATQRRNAAVAEIAATLRSIQADDGVPADNRATTRLVPRMPPVTDQRGSVPRAALAAGLLGLALTVAAVVGVDQLRHRRGRPRRVGRFEPATSA